MEIKETSTYLGPSVYSPYPVLRLALAGLPRRLKPREISGLANRLAALLPELEACWTSCTAQHAPTDEETAASGPIGHFFEHVCIELQNLVGTELRCVRNAGSFRKSAMDVIVPFEEKSVGMAAARLASDLVATAISERDAPDASSEEREQVERRLEEFVKFGVERLLPVQDRALIRTARALDVPVTRLAGRIIQLGHGCFQQRLSATKTTHTNIVSNDLAANKDYSRRVLEDLGLPVPRYRRVYRRRDAVEAARRIGYPVVVKPNNGSMGGGVSVGMKNREEVRDAYQRARRVGRSVLVEELVEGHDYRMLVIDGELHAAAKRVPAHVVGDGVHTIEELVDEVNRDPRRGSGPTNSWTRIELDDRAERLMRELGYHRGSIPVAGEVVYLRRNANTSDGGTAVDVTDEVHPDNREIAVRAAKAIGLDIAGVDLLSEDISSSMWKNGGRICEINSRPGLRKHLWPAEGRPRDVMTPVLEMLFPSDRPSRIPIVAITGTARTRMAARMLEHILARCGHHVGLVLKNRVYSGGRRIPNTRRNGPAAVRTILLDPDVDVAVLEIDPRDALRNGLGCDAFDVAVILNESLGASEPGSDEMLEVNRLVARTTRGVVCVEASDSSAEGLDREVEAKRLCRVGRGEERVSNRTPAVGLRAELEADSIAVYHRRGEPDRIPQVEMLARLPEVDPEEITRGAQFASLSAHFLGKNPREIYRALSRFRPRRRRRPRGREINPT